LFSSKTAINLIRGELIANKFPL